MKENVKLEDILNLYNDISKKVKNKNKVYNFEKNKMQNINDIINILKSGNYNGGYYNIFLIREPKLRVVMALSLKDKIINYYFTKYVLEKKLTKYLDNRNIATRKNMGCNYGIKLLKKYLELNKKYNNIYVLKLDISKYFYSIDHKILKNLIKDKVDNFEYEFLCKIIDSTNKDYINKKIDKYNIGDLPRYSYGKGLPIGNVSSQFLSIFYLYKLDYYIIHNLQLKYYIRYMDDFIIISHDKNKLINAYKLIEDYIYNCYKLKLNKKKCRIINVKDGFDFLGLNIRLENKKTIIKINNNGIKRIKKKIKMLKYLYDNKYKSLEYCFCSIMSYYYRNYSISRVRRIIDNYWFYE